MKPLNRIPILLMALILMVSVLFGGVASASDLQQQVTFQAPLLVVNTSFLNVRTGPGVQYSVLVTVVGGTELPVLGVFRDHVWYQVNTDAGPGWLNVEFTLPRGDFSNVPLVDVGAVGAANVNLGQNTGTSSVTTSAVTVPNVMGYNLTGKDMHQGPSYDTMIMSRSVPNDPTTVYPLLDVRTINGETWYQVNVPNVGIGWVDHVQLRLLECGSVHVGVLQESQPINFDGIENRASFLLPVGTEGYILGYRGASVEFTRFQLVDGTVGFVPSFAISQRTGIESVCSGVPTGNVAQDGTGTSTSTNGVRTTIPQLAVNHIIVNTAFLNIRSGPSAGYSVVATVPGGASLVVLGRAKDDVWFLVQGDFGQGWINNTFTLFRGTYSTVPLITEPVIISSGVIISPNQTSGPPITSANPSEVFSGIAVTGLSLVGKDMHEGPSYNTMIINRSVPNDRSIVYPLLATQENNGTLWYFVSIPNIGAGWMDAVELRALQCGNDRVGVAVESQAINFDGLANREPYLLPIGTEVYILGVDSMNRFIVALLDGSVGYVPTSAIGQRTGVTSICNGVSSSISNQATGSTNTSTIGGTTTVPVPQVTGNRLVVNTGNLNVRSGPSAGFSIVATVPGGSELAVIGRAADGVWYYVQGSFGTGWINNQFVLFRGDYATVPVINF
jgi:uncharacterized protein YgiM (DUF1202 family)